MKVKRIKYRIISLLFLFFLFLTANAQSVGTVTGVVITTDGAPIELVSVGVKGTNKGSYTDENGRFSLNVVEGNYLLKFSYLGYDPVEQSIQVKANKTTDLGNIIFDLTSKELDEVVVNAMITKFAEKKSDYVARMPIKNLENPQVYTVIPKELLSEQIAVDFKNVLTASPGVSGGTLGVGSGGTGLSMRLRGFAGADGAGSIRNGMATNFVSLSDPANLESIEVIKGPSGTLFGTTLISYGGLINRVTKKAYDRQGGEFGFSAGAWGLGRVTADYNTPLDASKKVLFRVNTALHNENSFKDYGVNKTFMVSPTLTFNVNNRLTVNLDAEYFKSERTTSYINLSGIDITNLSELDWDWDKSFASNDITSKSEVLNIFGEAKYKISDKWTSQTLVSYAHTDNDANYIFLDVASKDSLSRRTMHIPSIFTTQQLQQNFNGDFYLGNFRNRVLVGLDYTRLTTSDTRSVVNIYDKGLNKNITGNIAIHGETSPMYIDQYNQKMASPNRLTANKRFTRTYSAYVSDVFNLTEQLDVMASVRFDRFDNVESNYMQSAWSPKFGIVYQILKDKASVFANYMNGFQNKGPGAYNEDGDTKAFKPEHAFQWEGGFKLEFFDRKLNSTISLYHIKVEDRLRTVTAPSGSAVASYSVQDGTQVSKGFEIDLIANPTPGMHIIIGYGFNDNEFTKGGAEGKRDVGTPKHLANFWISHKLLSGTLKGLGFGLGGNFASRSYLDSSNKYEASGYGKFDATIFYEYNKVRFGAKINNLTDKRYWLVDYYAETQSPRQFLANVTYKF